MQSNPVSLYHLLFILTVFSLTVIAFTLYTPDIHKEPVFVKLWLIGEYATNAGELLDVVIFEPV